MAQILKGKAMFKRLKIIHEIRAISICLYTVHVMKSKSGRLCVIWQTWLVLPDRAHPFLLVVQPGPAT